MPSSVEAPPTGFETSAATTNQLYERLSKSESISILWRAISQDVLMNLRPSQLVQDLRDWRTDKRLIKTLQRIDGLAYGEDEVRRRIRIREIYKLIVAVDLNQGKHEFRLLYQEFISLATDFDDLGLTQLELENVRFRASKLPKTVPSRMITDINRIIAIESGRLASAPLK